MTAGGQEQVCSTMRRCSRTYWKEEAEGDQEEEEEEESPSVVWTRGGSAKRWCVCVRVWWAA